MFSPTTISLSHAVRQLMCDVADLSLPATNVISQTMRDKRNEIELTPSQPGLPLPVRSPRPPALTSERKDGIIS